MFLSHIYIHGVTFFSRVSVRCTCLTHSKTFKVSHCPEHMSNMNALLVICCAIHPLTLFFLLLTSELCMPQSAVPFSMTCAFPPPQWVTVSLPLVYRCVTAQSSDICRSFRQRVLYKCKCLHLSTDWPQQHKLKSALCCSYTTLIHGCNKMLLTCTFY